MYDEHSRSSMPNFHDIGHFHHKFGLPSVVHDGAYPRHPDHEMIMFRIKFLVEELMETADALGWQIIIDRNGGVGVFAQDPAAIQNPNHAEAFDGLLDLVVVAMGTAHILGYPWQAGWNRVQAANMSKVRAKADGSDSKRGTGYDIVKPEGFKPPDIESLLHDYGWGDQA